MSVSNSVVAKNMFWRYGERFLAQAITFLVSLVLARLISPNEYGYIALISVIIGVFEVFSSRGFNQALIQKKEIDLVDYSTIFITNIVIELFLYIIIFLCAPFISRFYNNSQLTIVLRVLGLKLIINAFNSVQQAYVQRNMLFKKFFFSTLIGTLISAFLGIFFAFRGAGIWALVIQTLSNNIIDTIVLFFTIELKPKILFSFKKLKEMRNFGTKMLFSGLTESILSELRSILIGKLYSPSDLAFYNKGQSLPFLVINSIQISAGNVFFAAMSREKNDEAIKEKARLYLSCMFYVLFPMLLGLMIVSEPFLIILYSDRWLGATNYVKIFSLVYVTWIPQMIILQALNSSGRAGLSLRLIIVKRIFDFIFLFATIKKGPLYIALGNLICDVLITFYSFMIIKKVFKYTLGEFINDFGNTVVITIISMCIILFLGSYINNYLLKFFAQVFIAIINYLLMSRITRNQVYIQLNTAIAKKIARRKKY